MGEMGIEPESPKDDKAQQGAQGVPCERIGEHGAGEGSQAYVGDGFEGASGHEWFLSVGVVVSLQG